MPLTVIEGPTIAAGEALSDGVDCTGGRLVRLTMPAAWTPANITFQISSDNVFFNDLFDAEGNEVMLAVRPGTAVILPSNWMNAVAFLKIRSGRSAAPVAQEAQRAFALAIETAA